MQAARFKLKILDPNKEQITNDWTIERIANEWAPLTWEKVFEGAKYELKDISDILEEDKKEHGRFYPDCKNIFRALEVTPLNKVKVVIMGQDPYHSHVDCNGIFKPQAVGMSFSIPREAKKIPSSLQNIYKELLKSVPGFKKPNHGDLTGWATQGVLLLNQCLTVRPGCAGSHKEVWMSFIKKVILAVLNINPKCIFILWGRKAQKLKKIIGQRATILEAAHPSGLSANRGFFGCNHFNEINRLLRESGQKEIDWNLP